MFMPLGWALGLLLLRLWGKQLPAVVRIILLLAFMVLWIVGAAVYLLGSK